MPARGHVEPHGAALREALDDGVSLTKLSVGPMDNNVYLIRCTSGSLLIDAANDAERIDTVVGQALGDDRPGTIVTTHQHGDHLQALADLAGQWGSRLVAGSPDTAAIAEAAGVTEPDGVWDGDQVACGELQLEVIGLVGHTPGSITLAFRPAGDGSGQDSGRGSGQSSAGPAHLFTGDSLFPGGPGKTRSKADFTSLLDDLEQKVFAVFDDDTVVHPGHGDDTTLGAERPQLSTWRSRGW